jgi:23S rRNA G2445 N2-methylase RlmL
MSAGWIPSWWDDVGCTKTVVEQKQKQQRRTTWQGLLDPFCGSGTIVIEGTAMALGLPPGRFRIHSPFQGTILEDQTKWSQLLSETNKREQNKILVSGSDRDAGAIMAAKANAERADVEQNLILQQSSISGQPCFDDRNQTPSSLLIVTNPPFGKRIAAKVKQKSNKKQTSADPLLPLYQTLLKSVQSLGLSCDDNGARRKVRCVILTDNARFVRSVSEALSKIDDDGDGIVDDRRGMNFRTLMNTKHGGLDVSIVQIDFLGDA